MHRSIKVIKELVYLPVRHNASTEGFADSSVGKFCALSIKVSNGNALPAMGGPTVMGTDMRPSRKPMAWDTSLAPTSSKAMGAMMQMKQPSNSPISRHTAMRPPKMLHSGIIMDMRPMTKKDVTWRGDREEQREPFEYREL